MNKKPLTFLDRPNRAIILATDTDDEERLMTTYEDAFRQLDASLLQRMERAHSPGLVLALTDRSSLVRLSALGSADLSQQTPLQPETLFAIGSVGKSFTGVAVLQAAEERLLDLHAPVTDYLPWFAVKSNFQPITIHHLLTHSSGLPRGTDFSPDPRAEVYALRELETGFAPGSHFSYSDVGYKVLGLILEQATGKTYAERIREKILLPLEMHNTFAVQTHDLRTRMASGYRSLYDDRPAHSSHPLVPAEWLETNSADGSIVSTAEDMARFARMLLNEGQGPHGPVLSELAFRKMAFPMIEDEGEAYSYGLYLFEDEGIRHAGHGGDIPGYESYMWLDLDNGLGTVLLATTPYPARASFLALEFFRDMKLTGRMPEIPPLPDFTHVSNPGDYAGVFHSRNCSLTLRAETHRLVLACEGQHIPLEERGIDTFYANHPKWNRYLLRFGRSPRGEVVEVTYGPHWLYSDRYHGQTEFHTPQEWEAFTGHYRAHNPWASNFRVYARKGRLILSEPDGSEEFLTPLGNGLFRLGEEEYIPERIRFDEVVEGKALRATRSGCPYYRFFTE